MHVSNNITVFYSAFTASIVVVPERRPGIAQSRCFANRLGFEVSSVCLVPFQHLAVTFLQGPLTANVIADSWYDKIVSWTDVASTRPEMR